jgi:DeoR/GlpR family transcriptional regulator of sugar metabolism
MNERRKVRRTEQRQEQISQVVLSQGSATAQELALSFGISLNTVHRDLDELERQGIVRKFHGGVTAQPSGVFEANVAYRLKRMMPEKRLVARHAARYVEPGMSIMLDDSTTALQLVPRLSDAAPLQVVTNYLEAMRQLSGMRGVSLMALGGDYDPLHDSFGGVMCIACIESLRVDAAFISTSAVSGGDAYHQEQRIVAFKRAMLRVAARRFLLVDHSKLGTHALHRLVALSAFDLVIVDPGASPAALAELDQHRVHYEVAAGDAALSAGDSPQSLTPS